MNNPNNADKGFAESWTGKNYAQDEDTVELAYAARDHREEECERCLEAFAKLGEELAEHDRKVWRGELPGVALHDGVVAKARIDELVKTLRGGAHD